MNIESDLIQTCAFIGLNLESFQTAIKKIKTDKITLDYRDNCNPNNPTRNYCYVISECIFHFLAPKGSFAYRTNVPDDELNHYYVVWPNGFICDLAQGHLKKFNASIYDNGKKCVFRHPSPSVDAKRLAKLLDIED